LECGCPLPLLSLVSGRALRPFSGSRGSFGFLGGYGILFGHRRSRARLVESKDVCLMTHTMLVAKRDFVRKCRAVETV
jgi:hypothetical protein